MSDDRAGNNYLSHARIGITPPPGRLMLANPPHEASNEGTGIKTYISQARQRGMSGGRVLASHRDCQAV